MAVDFAAGTPLATALQSVVQPKLAECGWTSGTEDSALCEYILLMLGNGKNEAQIASELSTDLLDLGPENVETQQFAHWLFEQIDILQRQLNGEPPAGASDAENTHSNDNQNSSSANDISSSAQDTEMEGAAEPTSAIPTGPKAMRNGSGSKAPRDKRMINQLNKQMDRPDDALHRVRGTAGTGRINSHSSREPPKGPRNQQVGRGMAAMANGRAMGNVNMGMSGMNGMNGMHNMGGMPGMPMPPMGQNGMGQMLNPQQQMALMQMYEQQAQFMQQVLSGQTPTPFINPNFQTGNRNGQGKSLFERVDKSSKAGNKQHSKFQKKEGQDETMTDSAATAEKAEGSLAMDVETARPDPATTMCRFNLKCTKPDCPFVHQSPAAPEGTAVDMSDTCTFGAACTNKKCAGKHPSPGQRQQHKSATDCVFYPNCKNANCPFRHPTMPPCRNGADCTAPDCKFYHSQVMCKYNPCTNRFCTYKHVEGQKKDIFAGSQWTKNGEESKEHVSERKFVDENAPEELIIPGQTSGEDTQIMT
ncbi:hypothetical protein K469DRAFT_616395 [Zopfia rhizophila CBS 207.26]|uniref:Nab2-like CCCH zinc finger domain-containing protein n=1 Tax=Zopfia rhizophila CBS 207.26 TaxID=1314779 RepID=A0A6A6EXX0_9PEZI|nr:hypothetical protein K469DRAFT_616395 [Zopfia rhizophila CBS 207.26]